MKKATRLLALCALAPAFLTAQNLVKNGSFEEHKCEPKGWGQINRCSAVSSANNTTVDYYGPKACKGQAKSTGANFMGAQNAFEGNYYAGIIAYYGDQTADWSTLTKGEGVGTKSGYNGYTEYIQMEFSQALTAGTTYKIAFQVSLADQSAFAVSGLGAYITGEKMNTTKNTYLDVEPQISSAAMTDNVSGWTEISGNYTAKGGEMYLIIGCFKKGMDKKMVAGEKNTMNMRRAYYFVDGVNVAVGEAAVTKPKVELNGNIDDFAKVMSGQSIALKGLTFETGSAKIKTESYAELDKWVKFMNEHPELKINIEGHTDKTGNETTNQKLSEQRAASVKAYFVSKGIAADRMKTAGYGSSKPIDTKNAASVINRRVEISVQK